MEIKTGDIIDIPAGSDHYRHAPYRMNVRWTNPASNGRVMIEGTVIDKTDGTNVSSGYVNVVLDPHGIRLHHRPGTRVNIPCLSCEGNHRRHLDAQDSGCNDSYADAVERKATGQDIDRYTTLKTSGVGRYGQPVQRLIKETSTPGAVFETCLDTGIETCRSLPGTHDRGFVAYPAELPSGAQMTWWRRVINGRLYDFTKIVMSDGETRYVVQRHTGYSDLRFSCAWEQVHFITVPATSARPGFTPEDDDDEEGLSASLPYADAIGRLVSTGRLVLVLVEHAEMLGPDLETLTSSQVEILRSQVQVPTVHAEYHRG